MTTPALGNLKSGAKQVGFLFDPKLRVGDQEIVSKLAQALLKAERDHITPFKVPADVAQETRCPRSGHFLFDAVAVTFARPVKRSSKSEKRNEIMCATCAEQL